LKVGCVNGYQFDPREQKALPSHLDAPAECEVVEGDVLLSRGNTAELVGMVAAIGPVRSRLLLSDLLYRLRADENQVNAHFFSHSLRSAVGRYQIESAATGTSASMKKISQGDIRELRIALPPVHEQRDIVAALATELQRPAAGRFSRNRRGCSRRSSRS